MAATMPACLCQTRAISVRRPANAAVVLPPRCRPTRRRRGSLLLLASAASMPAPDSSNISSNGASQPDTNGSGAEVPVAAPPAADVEPSSSSGGGGIWGWIRAQQQKSAELRTRLAALGLAAVLSYGGCGAGICPRRFPLLSRSAGSTACGSLPCWPALSLQPGRQALPAFLPPCLPPLPAACRPV